MFKRFFGRKSDNKSSNNEKKSYRLDNYNEYDSESSDSNQENTTKVALISIAEEGLGLDAKHVLDNKYKEENVSIYQVSPKFNPSKNQNIDNENKLKNVNDNEIIETDKDLNINDNNSIKVNKKLNINDNKSELKDKDKVKELVELNSDDNSTIDADVSKVFICAHGLQHNIDYAYTEEDGKMGGKFKEVATPESLSDFVSRKIDKNKNVEEITLWICYAGRTENNPNEFVHHRNDKINPMQSFGYKFAADFIKNNPDKSIRVKAYLGSVKVDQEEQFKKQKEVQISTEDNYTIYKEKYQPFQEKEDKLLQKMERLCKKNANDLKKKDYANQLKNEFNNKFEKSENKIIVAKRESIKAHLRSFINDIGKNPKMNAPEFYLSMESFLIDGFTKDVKDDYAKSMIETYIKASILGEISKSIAYEAGSCFDERYGEFVYNYNHESGNMRITMEINEEVVEFYNGNVKYGDDINEVEKKSFQENSNEEIKEDQNENDISESKSELNEEENSKTVEFWTNRVSECIDDLSINNKHHEDRSKYLKKQLDNAKTLEEKQELVRNQLSHSKITGKEVSWWRRASSREDRYKKKNWKIKKNDSFYQKLILLDNSLKGLASELDQEKKKEKKLDKIKDDKYIFSNNENNNNTPRISKNNIFLEKNKNNKNNNNKNKNKNDHLSSDKSEIEEEQDKNKDDNVEGNEINHSINHSM